MKYGSMLFDWYVEEFKGEPERVRGVERLLREGHTGLAESAVVRALKAKRNGERIKVTENGISQFI